MFENLRRNIKECFKPVSQYEYDNVKVVSPPEPEPKEQTEIEVEGSYKFSVDKSTTHYMYYLTVNYDVVASFGLHMIPIKSSFKIERPKGRRFGSQDSDEMTEEQAYEFILKTLRGDTMHLRTELAKRIRWELDSELDKRELSELKKQVKLNKSYDLSFSFNVNKSERYK